MNSRGYPRWRHRRRAAWLDVDRKCKHPDDEANLHIEFASMWVPYGGANEEEILVRFGMTTGEFIGRLWHLVPESSCDQEEIRRLASVYPRQEPQHVFPARTAWLPDVEA